MAFRFYFFFLFFTFFFLFYPGEHPYYQIVANERSLFNRDISIPTLKIEPIPVLRNQTEPSVTAEGVYVVDIDSYTPIFQKNKHTRLFPASTTKVITALVAQDIYKQDQVIKVNIASIEGQLMGLIPEERITVENLMYGILVQSGNDAAYALANEYGYDAFVELMNKKAEALHMKDSQFRNPAGLDAEGQMSSPYDLALAARALLSDPYLRKIVGTKEIIISDEDYKIFHTLTNVNKLLGEVQGLGGLKTGYTELAGENLISFYRHQGHDYIIVVMKSQDRFEDTTAIVNWINANVDYKTPTITE